MECARESPTLFFFVPDARSGKGKSASKNGALIKEQRSMITKKVIYGGLIASTLLGAVGCSNLPGNKESQGAVIGGLGGAAAGAAVGGEKHRLLGAILGGALGAGGGYVIGANSDKIMGKDTQAATQAQQTATQNPATPAQARSASTADINRDGFVTLDE